VVETGSYSELLTGLAGINLGVSLGSLVLSATTLQEVRRLQEKVDAVLFGLERIHSRIDQIAQKVDRIDMRVAENNLREAMRHVMARAVSQDRINLSKLADLRNDLDNLFEAMESPVYFNFGIRLATDVRDNLMALFALLAGVRTLVAHRHNQMVSAVPEMVVTLSPATDYLVRLEVKEDINSAIAYARMRSIYQSTHLSMMESVNSRFSFSDEQDLEHFSALMEATFADPVTELFNDHFSGGKIIFSILPEEIFEDEPDKVADRLMDLSHQWLWDSDGGLLMRTKLELDALAHGYDKTFWRHLSDEENVPMGCINVALEVPS
jgi:uncharacterized protein YlzI (FlbEa/FlbD family)